MFSPSRQDLGGLSLWKELTHDKLYGSLVICEADGSWKLYASTLRESKDDACGVGGVWNWDFDLCCKWSVSPLTPNFERKIQFESEAKKRLILVFLWLKVGEEVTRVGCRQVMVSTGGAKGFHTFFPDFVFSSHFAIPLAEGAEMGCPRGRLSHALSALALTYKQILNET